jgi:hypothetical protein
MYSLFLKIIQLLLNIVIRILTAMKNDVTKTLTKQEFQTDISPDHCKIHPHGFHNQSQCRQKCQTHPLSEHRNVDCRKFGTQIRACHPSRAGLHAEPFWCLFCNTVTPKIENNRCFHCWKCSNQTTPLYSKDCPCPNRFKK